MLWLGMQEVKLVMQLLALHQIKTIRIIHKQKYWAIPGLFSHFRLFNTVVFK